MKHSGLIKLSLLCFTALTLSFLSSCYEPIEGCLDTLSANYQLDADNTCDDCCSYPSIDIQFFPMWDSINLVTFNQGTINRDTVILDTIIMDTVVLDSMIMDTIILDTIFLDTVFTYLTNDVQQELRITQSQFLVSNIFLTGGALSKLSTQDSVSLDCSPPEILYNTVDLISLSNQSTEIENVILDFGYDSIHFDIGITECLANTDTIGLTSQITTLENLSEAQLSENEFLSLSLTIEFVDNEGIERVFSFVNSEVIVSLGIGSELDDFSISRGRDLSIDIDVNYDEWFSNILSSDTDTEIKLKLIQNAKSAFSLRN